MKKISILGSLSYKIRTASFEAPINLNQLESTALGLINPFLKSNKVMYLLGKNRLVHAIVKCISFYDVNSLRISKNCDTFSSLVLFTIEIN